MMPTKERKWVSVCEKLNVSNVLVAFSGDGETAKCDEVTETIDPWLGGKPFL